MKDIIVNGKFSQGGVFSTNNWIIHNVKITPPSNPYLDTTFYIEGASNTYPFKTVPPGIYQKINISSDYKKGANINFKYTVSYKSEVALERQENLSAHFYIYRIDPSFFGGPAVFNNIYTVGNVRTYTQKRNISIYYDEQDALSSAVLTEEDEVNITLGPGDYVVGFGADYIGVSETFMSDANKLTGLGIIEIEGLIENDPATEDTLPFITKDFQGFDKEITPDEAYYLPVERDGMDLGIKCPKNTTVEEQIQDKDGVWADFNIKPYTDEDPDDLVYTGRISFWHRCESGVTGDFAVYVYDRDTGYVWFNKKIKATSYWSFYIEEFDIWDGRYEILIIPPKNNSTSSGDKYFIVNNIDLTLRIDSKLEGSYPPEGSGGDGTYGNPYNENDGYIGYRIDVNGSKVSYVPRFVTDMPLRSQVYYVRIKNKYYMTKGTQTHYLCANGFYDLEGNYLEDPIEYSGTSRYFQLNGTITENEYFCVNGEDIYIADDRGLCYYSCKVLKSMSLSINNLPITGKEIIDIPRNKTIDITATFEEQCPSILLKIMSSDEDVIKCIGVNKNEYNGVFGYNANKSNTLTIQGVKAGIATITVLYESITGSIVTNSFIMEVRSPNEYPANLDIDLAYKENYIYYGQEYQIKHRVRPIISSDLPLYWYVDRDDIFSITNDGVIKVKDGVARPDTSITANITIINYGSGLVETCKIHMLRYKEDLRVPTKVKLTERSEDYSSKTYTMTVGDVIDFRDETLGSSGTSLNVFQNVKWYPGSPSVVTIDQFGTVTALKEGKARISCSCQQDAYLAGWIDIIVEPDEESLVLQKIELNTSKAVIFNSEDSFSNRYSEEYLSCVYMPPNTRQTGVTWSSDDPSIAKVDESGRVYCDPVSDDRNGATTTIRCTSIYNKNLVATCEVTTYNWDSYKPILWLSKHELKAAINEQTVINYAISNCDYIEYIEDSIRVEIRRSDDVQTINEVTLNRYTQKIFVDINETGKYKIVISMQYKKLGDDKIYYMTDTCMLEAIRGTYAPTVTKDLEVLYALYDRSYVLRCDVVNEVAENFQFKIIIDGNESLVYAEPLMYDGERYFYIFEKMDYPGSFKVQVKVENYNNGNYYIENTKEVTVTIPENEDNKRTLIAAKTDYDKATDDIINYIAPLIIDNTITAEEQAEFKTRFNIFNTNYENMKITLDECIDFIDEQIKQEQAEMSLMATSLSSGGVQTAAYSIEENTNSNYSNVTDMDYYQNECIKALMQRVLELEARLEELANNNNN